MIKNKYIKQLIRLLSVDEDLKGQFTPKIKHIFFSFIPW